MQPHHDPVHRLNEHHGEELLSIARAFGGTTDAVAARATAIDDDGITLVIVNRDGGELGRRVPFPQSTSGPRRRLAFRELAEQAASLLDAGHEG